MKLFGLLFICLGFFPVCASEKNIKSSRAQIYEAPKFSAKKIASPAKDEKVKVLEESGRWLKVSYKNLVGHIPAIFVGKGIVAHQKGVEIKDLEKKVRARASKTGSAASARGLSASNLKLDKSIGIDFSIIRKIHLLKVKKRRGRRFLIK